MATRTRTFAEILSGYLINKNLDVDIDEILVRPCCRTVLEEGVLTIMDSFQAHGITTANRISIHVLSPEEKESSGRRYSIIDGAHRVTALQRLYESGKTSVKTLNAAVYADAPDDVLLLAASVLNESSETVVKTSILDRMFFISQLFRLSAFPAACYNQQRRIVPTKVMAWLQKQGYNTPGSTVKVIKHVIWGGQDYVDYLVTRAAEVDGLHELYSEGGMTKFQAKATLFPLLLKKAFVDRLVVLLKKHKARETTETFGNMEQIIDAMCDRAHKAWKEFEAFGVVLGELYGTAPFAMHQLTSEEQQFCQQLLIGSDINCEIALRDTGPPTGHFGKFSVFFEKRRAALFELQRANEAAAGRDAGEAEIASVEADNLPESGAGLASFGDLEQQMVQSSAPGISSEIATPNEEHQPPHRHVAALRPPRQRWTIHLTLSWQWGRA
jgi:hypothetical protein